MNAIHNMCLSDCEQCFASKTRGTIIDVLHPITGRTVCYGKDLATTRVEYPDAEQMTVEEFCQWKAEQQRTPITWKPATRARFVTMLEVLPPAWAISGYAAFLVGEPSDHDAGNGLPRYEAYRLWGQAHFVASRPLTIPEMKAELDKLGYR